MIKFIMRALKKISWFSFLLVVVWLVVLGVIAQRYFQVRNTITEQTNQNPQTTITNLKNRDLIYDKASNTSELWSEYLFANSRSNNNSKTKQLNLINEVLYTSLGEVHAIYDASSQRFTLYLNQVPIQLINTPIVNYAFQLNDQQVVLILAGEIIGRDYIYTLVDLNAKESKIIYDAGNFERLIDAELKPDKKCINMRFEDARKYAESDGYQVYQYCGSGNVSKVIDVKSEEYYHDKFADITAQEIYQQAINDGCFDVGLQSFNLKRSCSYGIKYCQPFHEMESPIHDYYYQVIQQACQKKDNLSMYRNDITLQP